MYYNRLFFWMLTKKKYKKFLKKYPNDIEKQKKMKKKSTAILYNTFQS